MRTYALMSGMWFASTQMSLIFCLSFLHSATLPAYLSVMLSWFLGSAAGSWLPPSWPNGPLMLLSGLAHLTNTLLLTQGQFLGSWWMTALLGGLAGGHWVRRWCSQNFSFALSWESMGLALGFLFCGLATYRWGLAVIYFVPIGVTLPTVWLERGLRGKTERL